MNSDDGDSLKQKSLIESKIIEALTTKYHVLPDLNKKIENDVESNEEFIQEKKESESEEYIGKGYSNVDIEFEDINWPFENVKSRDDLEAVLNNSESFKNYEPYHNGNSRSSRKVPKPYDEHFVNFRSY